MGGETPSWGTVSTVRGPSADILRFAAHHLDMGADCLHLFLDEPNPTAFAALNQHPKVKVRICDSQFWANRQRERPAKHQTRQTANASFAYRKAKVDWLAHIDLDEFLWSERPIRALLAQAPDDIPALRVRPVEALARGRDRYKAFIPAGPDREAIVQSVYPNFGAFVKGGFLSHLQGKLFVRTGLPKVNLRIHNLYQNGELRTCKTELPNVNLCHRHAPDWDHFLAHYQFRTTRGSYQPGMSPNAPRELGGMNMNELMTSIKAEGGQQGLKAFFDEISGVDPGVYDRLEEHGMILHRPLNLDQKVRKHFPGTI